MTIRLHYRIDGNGPRVLLLHAVGMDLTFLDPVAAALAQDFTVLRVDLRGHGHSPHSPTAGLEDYADDVHASLAELNFAPCAIAGFAFGGMVAQVLALKYPADTSALVIASCPSAQTPDSSKIVESRATEARRDGIASILDSVMERWFNDAFIKAGGDAAVRARLLSDDVDSWADGWRAMSTIAAAPRLKDIKVPALCLVGEMDKSTPPPIAQAMAAAIPGGRYAIMRGAPHMMFIEQPSETGRVVGSFLKAVLA